MEEFLRRAHTELEAAENEMSDVRAILADAVARLLVDLQRREPGVPSREALTALQFQDISDQLLAHAGGRLVAVRAQLRDHCEGRAQRAPLAPRAARPVHTADLQPGSAELF